MLTEFEISHYRAFKTLRLDDFARVNLIAGRNNAGKTALLEALFLHLGPTQPHLAAAFPHRGEGRTSFPALPPGWRYIDEWRTLFFDEDFTHPAELHAQLADGSRHDLNISLRESSVQVIEPGSNRGNETGGETAATSTTQEIPFELVYDYSGSDGVHIKTVATPTVVTSPGGMYPRERLRVEKFGTGRPSLPRATFLGTDPQPRYWVAEQFSKLRDQRRHGPIEQILRELEPRLRQLEIRVEGRRPELAADLGLAHIVPLRMMGEGVSRLLEILLAVFSSEAGILLVDEIENGLHHSVLVKVCRALMTAAEEARVQVFATTHSFECIRAAHSVAVAEPSYELSLHRLEMNERGEASAVPYDRNTLDLSLDQMWEVR